MNYIHAFISFILFWVLFAFQFFFIMTPFLIHEKPKKRCYQFAVPFLCLLVVCLGMFNNDAVLQFLYDILIWIANLAGQIPLLGRYLYAFFAWLAGTILTGLGAFVWSNILLALFWLLVKKLTFRKLVSLWENHVYLFDLTSGEFYEKDERTLRQYTNPQERYVLKPRYYNLRVLIMAAVFFCYFIYLITQYVYSGIGGSNVPAMMTPVAGILILGECFAFLNGWQPEKNEGKILAEEENSAECDTIRASLKKMFRDRLCFDDHQKRKTVAKVTGLYQEDALENTEIDELASAYFNSLLDIGIPLQPDYQKAARQLLNRESLVVMNPFYRDFTYYLMLPMIATLLKNKKVLVICGRSTDAQDIKEWITDGFLETTNLKKLWMTEELSEKGRSDDISVGIITFHNIYNHTFIHNNIGFLKEVQFVLLLEPSNLLGTGQIGLRNILEICESSGDPLTYCALDRSVDGLVDALSHLVHQPLVEVLAPPASEAGTCRAIWHVDGPGMQNRIVPGISRYLGVGTEIALEGLANGADEIYWFSSSKSPIADIRWNVSQYYPSFCEYTHTRLEQNQLEERMHYESHLWQVPEMEKGYLIVEDEFRNAFDIAHLFSSRLEKKGFVNILSENYMLRDYMTANAEMMTVDSKAIPTIVPDYARTERNFIIRLLMLMSMEPVDESYISNQLAIHGIHSRKTYDVLQHLIHKHTGQEKFKIHTTQVNAYRADIQATRFQYSINLDQLHSVYDSALRSVYFVIENEKTKEYPMGNRLLGQIYQVLLPGQFFSWDGRYYQVVSISNDSEIIVRRSGDHFMRRVYYRQLRDYKISGVEMQPGENHFRDMVIRHGFANIEVRTDGYLDLPSPNDFEHASHVRLKPAHVRRLYQKEFLQITLENVKPEVVYTLAVLLNEVFRTLFPNETGYLIALPGQIPEAVLNDPLYRDRNRAASACVAFEEEDMEKNAIYIVEDSHIDLGLLVTVERNLQRIMEIIADYLVWNSKGPSTTHREGEDDAHDVSDEDGSNETQVQNYLPSHKSLRSMASRPSDSSPTLYSVMPLFGFGRRKKDEANSSESADSSNSSEQTPAPAENPSPVADPADVQTEKASQADQPAASKEQKASASENVSGEAEPTPQTEANPEGAANPSSGTSSVETHEPPAAPEPEPNPAPTPEPEPEPAKAPDPKEGKGRRKKKRRGWFGRGRKDEDSEENAPEENGSQETGGGSKPESGRQPIPEPVKGPSNPAAIFAEDEELEEEDEIQSPFVILPYLQYGAQEVPDWLALDATLEYLRGTHFEESSLHDARTAKAHFDSGSTYDPRMPGIHYCDFCGQQLTPGHYDTLKDGRERCPECSATAVRNKIQFKRVVNETHAELEKIFNITFRTKLEFHMVNARKVNKHLTDFKPTPEMDPRCVGYASPRKGKTVIYVENGSPLWNVKSTIVHEMTHAWQFEHWNSENVGPGYDNQETNLLLHEGMAVWTEVQYYVAMGEIERAIRYMRNRELEDNEYGIGMRLYLANYPIQQDSMLGTSKTPFNTLPPIPYASEEEAGEQ